MSKFTTARQTMIAKTKTKTKTRGNGRRGVILGGKAPSMRLDRIDVVFISGYPPLSFNGPFGRHGTLMRDDRETDTVGINSRNQSISQSMTPPTTVSSAILLQA